MDVAWAYATVQMGLWDLAAHTIWVIMNKWSINQTSAMTSEGPAGYTYAMQRLLQITQSKEFMDGQINLTRHVAFPQPPFHHVVRPYGQGSKDPGQNLFKYALKASNAVRLMTISSIDRQGLHYIPVGIDVHA